MGNLIYIEEARKNEIIAAVIERGVPCVITSRGGQGWQADKSRFLPNSSVVGSLLLAAPARAHDRDGQPFLPGEQVGVAFRRGHKKCMFATTVVSQGEMDLTDADPATSCLKLEWPARLQELQRRAYNRATPPGRKVHVRFWPGGVANRAEAEAGPQGIRSGLLLDLSAGGIRIVTTDTAPDGFEEGDAVGCSFAPRPRGETIVLDGIFRHHHVDEEGVVSIGLQFVGLELSEAGRKTLSAIARIVTDYQRAHTRGRNRGLAHREQRS